MGRVKTGVVSAVSFSLLCLLPAAESQISGERGPAPAQTSSGASIRIVLTPEEAAWLQEHPRIKVAQDPAWPPVEFADDQGRPSGISNDYLNLVEQRLGFAFERVTGLTWQEAYDSLKRGELDMTTCVAPTAERESFWAFTRPYLKMPIVILTRQNVPYIESLQALAGKSIAVVDGYVSEEWIRRDHPEIRLVRVASVREGFDLVRKGSVEALVDNMLVIGYYLTKLKRADLKIVGQTPYVNAQAMAVRKDWAVLAGILQKALDSISEEEAAAISQKWVPVRYERKVDLRWLWTLLGAFGLTLSGLLFWIRKMRREIRKRLSAEEAAKANEARFKSVFEAANVGKSLTLPTGRINVNAAYCRMLGYSREELEGKTWQELTPPEEIPGIQERLSPLLRGEQDSTRFEKRYLHKNGSFVWCDVSAVIHRDEEGRPLFFITTVIDITERKRAEDALRSNEENYRLLFAANPHPMWVYDLETLAFLEVNHATVAKYGYSYEEFLSMTLKEIRPAEDIGRLLENVKISSGDFTFSGEWRHKNKRGDIFLVEIISHSIVFKGRSARLVMANDITTRKRSEEEREATIEVLRMANASRTTLELGRAAASYFQNRSGCEAVGLRLRDGRDFPYFETRGFPDDFVRSESRLCLDLDITDDQSGRENAGNPVLACMCGNVIQGRTDPSLPFFTAGGSFWTNSTSQLLASSTEADRQSRTRNRCHGEGYESVALIPLKAGEERLGLLQLNDRRPGLFTPQTIALWERLAGTLAVALSKLRAEETIAASLREKETIIREIQHRVKNSLQVISSLFNLQSGHLEDENVRRVFKEGQNRIRSMSLIHEKLYESGDLSKVDFAGYLRSLAAYLFQSFRINPGRIRLETELEDLGLDINSAVPCGLLANELISNVLKHAFPEGRNGVLRLGLKRAPDGLITLTVADDGIGFPPDLNFGEGGGFGFLVIHSLIDQLDGTIRLAKETGAAVTVAFRELAYRKRL